MSADDFKRIRWSLLLALAMTAVGVAAITYARQATLRQSSETQAAQAHLREVRGKLVRARDEEAEIKSSIGRFNTLVAAGIIGAEQRLEWVERIKAIRSARGLYDLQYEIAPQRPLDPSIAPGSSGSFEFLSSTMRLQMDLLHEEDLLRLLGDLRGSVHAYVRPQRCTIERIARSVAVRSSGAQLKADCVLDWITIQQRESGARME
jgi:hypothetical protein